MAPGAPSSKRHATLLVVCVLGFRQLAFPSAPALARLGGAPRPESRPPRRLRDAVAVAASGSGEAAPAALGRPAAPDPPCRAADPDPDSPGSAGVPVAAGLAQEDLQAVRAELQQDLAARDAGYALSRELGTLTAEAANALQYGAVKAADEAIAKAQVLLEAHHEKVPRLPGCRDGMLQQACEHLIKVSVLRWFLNTGTVLPRSSLGPGFDDEEYLAGVILASQELTRYALRRATAIDRESVRLCRGFITDVKAQLMGFDFRNGNLRRKYDGVKYAERKCEDLLYELSLSQESVDNIPRKQDGSTLDEKEWVQLQEAYAEYDQRRELVIKGCRDAQKAAKQAIFALHRGDIRRSADLIATANECVQRVWQEHVRDAPSLRYGSFAGALEELAEAEMFHAWRVQQKSDASASGEASAPAGGFVVPTRDKLAGGLLTAFEYVGALSDYTGEVGRVAVEAATRRDLPAVRRCLEVVYASFSALASMPLVGKQTEKVQAAERNLWKIEAIEYDMAVRVGSSRASSPLEPLLPGGGDAGGGGDGERSD